MFGEWTNSDKWDDQQYNQTENRVVTGIRILNKEDTKETMNESFDIFTTDEGGWVVMVLVYSQNTLLYFFTISA